MRDLPEPSPQDRARALRAEARWIERHGRVPSAEELFLLIVADGLDPARDSAEE